MTVRARIHADPRFLASTPSRAPAMAPARAYDQAGDSYLAYADGDVRRLFTFDGQYAYADRRLWSTIQAKLDARRQSGASTIRILDAGCGPGTWLRRAVAHAHALGFTRIVARGFDIAETQVRRARTLSRDVAHLPGVDLTFDTGDLTDALPEANASVDLGLCLYCVLNHLPASRLPGVAAEFGRVTAGHFIATVRAVGSTPTIYVDSLDKARDFKQDNEHDRCQADLRDGRHIEFDSHLFSARELRRLIGGALEVESLRGLDIFHSRFMPDRRWNPPSLEGTHQLYEELACLEETFASDPNFIDRATHLLAVAHRRPPQAARMRRH